MFSSLKNLFGKSANDGADSAPAASSRAIPFLGREPVFDRNGRIAGHLFRLPASNTVEDPDRLLLHALLASRADLQQSPAFVPISSASLDAPELDRLPGGQIVLLLRLAPDAEAGSIGDAMARLREREYRFGVFRQPRNPAFAKVIQQVDYAAIDIAGSEPNSVRDFSSAVRAGVQGDPIQLFACNIDTLDEHQLCLQWHFDYCHGHFVDHAAIASSAPAGDPHKTQLLNLLHLVQGDADTAELAKAMRLDPVLSFRILRYLNSPALALTRRIDSLEQAVTILGRQKLARWLAVLLFSVREPQLSDWLLIENALTRGRLMEVLGAQSLPGGHHDPLFLTGIFSCLDRLLRRPLADILQAMPVADAIRQALLEHQGPYASLLAVAEASEATDQNRMAEAARQAGVDAESVNRALLAATAWASEMTEYWE